MSVAARVVSASAALPPSRVAAYPGPSGTSLRTGFFGRRRGHAGLDPSAQPPPLPFPPGTTRFTISRSWPCMNGFSSRGTPPVVSIGSSS